MTFDSCSIFMFSSDFVAARGSALLIALDGIRELVTLR